MMIAVSIIGGKALGPIGGAVSNGAALLAARDAFARLKSFHKRYPSEPKRLSLPLRKAASKRVIFRRHRPATRCR